MSTPHRLLVTGAAGFIGSNFVRRQLLDAGTGPDAVAFILAFDKLTYAGNLSNLSDLEGNPSFAFEQGDIGDAAQIAALLVRHQITGVVNFAAESHVDRSIDSPEAFIQTNVVGTLRLLESSRHYWKGLGAERKKAFRFLHVSTDEVFGSLRAEDPAFTEETPFAPNSPYAASKAGSDHLVRAYSHTYGLPVLTGNCSNNYGPYQFPEKLIPLIILNCLEQQPLPVYGDGLQIRDWLYVGDHCRALKLILEEGKPGETYAIGGGNEIPNLTLVRQICKIMDELHPRSGGKGYDELIAFVADRPGHDRRYAINCEKIERELGWKPQESFNSGLYETVSWYLNNHDWCSEIQAKKYQRDRLGLNQQKVSVTSPA